MWFKTPVSLVSITEPSEILLAQSAKGDMWFIYARFKAVPEVTMKNPLWMSRGSLSNPSSYLALFNDGPDVSLAIAECMTHIEASIRAKADLCDLSQFGNPQAWGKAWKQIKWPS
jgi:hypothetical protein